MPAFTWHPPTPKRKIRHAFFTKATPNARGTLRLLPVSGGYKVCASRGRRNPRTGKWSYHAKCSPKPAPNLPTARRRARALWNTL